MPEQRERIEQALHGCAEAGVPETMDLWPEISERVSAAPRRSPRRFRLSPRTRIGWVFAVLAMFLIATTAAFAAAGALGVLDDLYERFVPGVQKEDLSVPINQTKTKGNVSVTIDRVYADPNYVVVGYTVEGVEDKVDSPGPLPYIASLSLSDPNERRAILSQESAMEQGGMEQAPPVLPEGSQASVDVFETTKPFEAGENQRFRASVLIEDFGPEVREGGSNVTQITKPFFFDFTVPIRDVPVIEVNQTVEAVGSNSTIGGNVPITLTEVVLSPARTSAYLCFKPPDELYDLPMVKTSETRIFRGSKYAAAPVYHNRDTFYGNVRKGCATYVFDDPLYGQPGDYSLTITELRGSRGLADVSVEGPWKFDFEVPEQ